MIWFEKGRIPEGQWPFLSTTYNGLRNIEEALVDKLDLTEGTGNILITGCMQAYRQAVMRRTLDLAAATVSAWNTGALTGSVVCARSLLETIAIYHSFLTRAQILASKKDWETIGKTVDAYAFATQSGPKKRHKTPEDPPRIAEAVKKYIQATQPGKEQFWEQICDTAHPNGKRMLTTGGNLKDSRYDARTAADNEPVLFPAIYNCLYSCCWLIGSDIEFNILLETIRTGEDLPSDHELIKERDLIDSAGQEVSATLGPMCPGPIKKK